MKKIRIKGIAIGKVESIPLSKNYDYEFGKICVDNFGSILLSVDSKISTLFSL